MKSWTRFLHSLVAGARVCGGLGARPVRAKGRSRCELELLVDEYALSREDQDSIGEQRFASLGMSGTGAVLVVVHTHREPDIYRLISSWKANKPQRNQYKKDRP